MRGSFSRSICVLLVAFLWLSPARGQSRDLAERLLSAHNQLGLLEFCTKQKIIGPEAAAYQQRLISLIPKLVNQDRADEARAFGQDGKFLHKGKLQSVQKRFGDAAALSKFCEALATSLVPETALPAKAIEFHGGFPQGR